MNLAKVWVFGLVVALLVAVGAERAWADDAAKTVSGKATCGGCSGVVKGCCVMVTDADGARWILRGDKAVLKEAFAARHQGKTVTATLANEPVTKKGKDGKDYKEVKVSDVKVSS